MALPTEVEGIDVIDPFFGSPRGLDIVRTVLDQARAVRLLDPTELSLSAAEIERLTVRHRVGPLLARGFPTPETSEYERRSMLTQMRLSQVSKEVCTTLASHGIESRVLKGLATCELDYDRPSRRSTGDVDLLIRRSDMAEAVELLLATGLVPDDVTAAHAGRLIDGRNLKGVVLIHTSGAEVDLHYRLSRFAPYPGGDVLMDRPSPLLGDRLALPAEGRIIHAAAHAVLSPNPGRRLSSVADIVAILDNSTIDWAVARCLADELGLTAAVGVGLRTEAEIMGREAHPGTQWPVPGRLMRWLTATSGRTPAAEHLAVLRSLPAGFGRRDYIADRLFPSSALRDQKGGRLPYYWGILRSGRRR